MLINDKRGKQEGLEFDDLIQGEVYVDVYNQKYVMKTDSDSVVDLESGEVFNSSYYHKGCEFIPVKATLEIE